MSFCKDGCCREELKSLNTLLNNYNGRDKFCKSVQYVSKLAVFEILASGGEKNGLAKQLQSLAGQMAMARKGFRLFKSLNEVDRVLDTVNSDKDMLLKSLTLLQALGFAFYWYYDNKSFFGKSGTVVGIDMKSTVKSGAKWWMLGLLAQLGLAVVNLQRLHTKLDNARSDPSKESGDANKIQNSINTQYLKLFAILMDILCCSNQNGLTETVLGQTLNDRFIGSAGLASALIVLYTIYPSRR